jgi:CRISPR/Cas system-associated endoribonuclease Cas2
MIDKQVDYIVIYKLANKNNLDRENVGKDFDPTSNVI